MNPMFVKLSVRRLPGLGKNKGGTIGGSVRLPGAPKSGRTMLEPIPTNNGQAVPTAPARPAEASQDLIGNTKPQVKSATALFGLPSNVSIGALMGLLFGEALDAMPEAAGAGQKARDAAIGAAAYASAEQQLAERLHQVQNPGVFPTVLGGMPIATNPLRRIGGLTL